MSGGVRIETAEGRAVVVKERPERSLLQAEHDRLLAAAHPGVVEVLGLPRSHDGWALRTVWSGRPLATGRLGLAAGAAAVAAVAETLADLHELGIVHGHLDGEQVLLAEAGQPRLCGFGPDAGGATRADDVAALGELLAAVAAGPVEGDPIPARRFAARRATGPEVIRRSLLTLADQATCEVATRRPNARRLAADIVAVLGTTPPAPHGRAEPRVPRRRLELMLAFGAFVSLVIVLLLRSTGESPTDEVTPLAAAAPTRLADAATCNESNRPADANTVDVDVDGDGCGDLVRVDGSIVSIGGQRWAVGAPGDLAVVGDWDCDGRATPAALRPSTGEVFVFAEWPASAEIAVRAADRVAGAERLVVEPGDGCHSLRAETARGTSVSIETGAPS